MGTTHAPARNVDVGSTAVVRRAAREFRHKDIADRAAALTYFGVLAIFPALLVLVSIFGLMGSAATQTFLDNLRQIAPSGVNTFLRTVIEQVQGRAGAASVAAVIGIVVALWSASGYVAAFMRSANAIYGVDEGRPIWRTVPVRIGVTVALVVMLVISVLIVTVTGPVANQIGQALGIGHGGVIAWDIAKWPVLLVIVCAMISFLYWACPNVKPPGARVLTAGSAVAVCVWLMVSGLFAVYLAFSGSYNKTYGALATVIIFLVWLWISNIAILLGVQIDAERHRARLIEAGLTEDVEPFVDLRDTRRLDAIERRRVEHARWVRRTRIGR